MNNWLKISLLATLTISGEAVSRTVNFSGKVETIVAVVGTPTIVRFDRPVKTVTNTAAFLIRPASEENPDYTTLAVEARSSKATSFVTFILADGTLVRTKVVATAKLTAEGGDNVYDFKTDEASSGGTSGPGTASTDVKAIDLMKAMIRGDKVMGYEVRELQKTLLAGEHGVRAELVKIYSGPDLNGYVIRLTNQSSKTYQVDIKTLRIGEPNLAILSQIDRRLVTGADGNGSETYLRIVARPGSVYRDIVLPVAPVKKDKGGGT